MSRRIREHISSNVVGYIALFFSLTMGSAYALDGMNTVFTDDIVNGEVKSADVAAGAVGSPEIAAGAVGNAKIAADAIADDTLNPLTGSTKIAAGAIKESELGDSSVFSSEVAPNTLTGADIKDDSLGGPDVLQGSLTGGDIQNSSIGANNLGVNSVGASEVADNSLTGTDIAESTFTALDAHDAFDQGCDPSTESFVKCAELSFTVGHRMPVLTTFTYGFSGFEEDPWGFCRTTLDGATTSVTTLMLTQHYVVMQVGGTPIVDVLTLDPGTHTLGFECNENDPDSHDLEVEDIRIAAVELGID